MRRLAFSLDVEMGGGDYGSLPHCGSGGLGFDAPSEPHSLLKASTPSISSIR